VALSWLRQQRPGRRRLGYWLSPARRRCWPAFRALPGWCLPLPLPGAGSWSLPVPRRRPARRPGPGAWCWPLPVPRRRPTRWPLPRAWRWPWPVLFRSPPTFPEPGGPGQPLPWLRPCSRPLPGLCPALRPFPAPMRWSERGLWPMAIQRAERVSPPLTIPAAPLTGADLPWPAWASLVRVRPVPRRRAPVCPALRHQGSMPVVPLSPALACWAQPRPVASWPRPVASRPRPVSWQAPPPEERHWPGPVPSLPTSPAVALPARRRRRRRCCRTGTGRTAS
jgi:hypothetical protein